MDKMLRPVGLTQASSSFAQHLNCYDTWQRTLFTLVKMVAVCGEAEFAARMRPSPPLLTWCCYQNGQRAYRKVLVCRGMVYSRLEIFFHDKILNSFRISLFLAASGHRACVRRNLPSTGQSDLLQLLIHHRGRLSPLPRRAIWSGIVAGVDRVRVLPPQDPAPVHRSLSTRAVCLHSLLPTESPPWALPHLHLTSSPYSLLSRS